MNQPTTPGGGATTLPLTCKNCGATIGHAIFPSVLMLALPASARAQLMTMIAVRCLECGTNPERAGRLAEHRGEHGKG